MSISRRRLLVGVLSLAIAAGFISAFAVYNKGQEVPPADAPTPAQVPAGSPTAKTTDLFGDPLPAGAVARIGTVRLRVSHEINHAALSPDGKLLVTNGRYGDLIVWDTGTGLETRTIKTPEYEIKNRSFREGRKYSEVAAAMAFAADSRHLHVMTMRGTLRKCDVATGKWSEPLAQTSREELDEFGRLEASSAVSPDGTHFTYTRFEEPSSRVEVFAVRKDKPILQIEDPELGSWGRKAQFSPDNKRLAIALNNGTLKVWDIASGQVRETYYGPDLSLLTYAFSPDWSSLAATFIPHTRDRTFSRPITLVTWDTASQKERLHISDWKGAVVGYSPDGKKLLSIDILDRSAMLLADAATGKPVGSLKGHSNNLFLHLDSTPDRKRLVTAGHDDGSLIVWDMEIEKPILDFDGPRGTIGPLAFSPDGETVFAATRWDHGSLWDARTGRRLHRLDVEEKGPCASAAFTPDGRHVVVGYGWGGTSRDGNWPARLWRVADGKLIREFPGHKDTVHHLAVSPDGKELATQDRSIGLIRLWEIDTGRIIRQGNWSTDYTARFTFARSGQVVGLAPGTFKPAIELRMVYPLGGPLIGWWEKPAQSRVHALSPDGDFVAMREKYQGGHEQIVIRRAATGEVTKGLLIDQGVSHPTPVAFSPNSQYVAVCNQTWDNRDATVHIFEMQTGREVRTLRGHRGSISALAFTPDAKRLATGSSDSTVLIWDLTGNP